MTSTSVGFVPSISDDFAGTSHGVEGQVRGVARMVEEDRYCIDVLAQISAIQAALEKIALGLVDGHVRHCMLGAGGAPADPDEQVAELMGAVGRLVKR